MALQLITALEALHECGYLHSDIKPDNTAIGLENKSDTVYLIDLGLATRYLTDEEQHKGLQLEEKFQGNPYWSSINTLRGLTPSRRDDLESLGYMLLFFQGHHLPWLSVKKKSFEARKKKVREKKEETNLEQLCEGGVLHYLQYVKRLKFEEKPDYAYLRSLFLSPESPSLDWLVCPAAVTLIQSRVPSKPSPTEWDCNYYSSSSDTSEADDSVLPLSPPTSSSPNRRRQTIANLGEVVIVPTLVEERRQSLCERYDQLGSQNMTPGKLMGKTETVSSLGRRNSCLPVMQKGEEAVTRKLPAISAALRQKLKQTPFT